MNAVRPCRHCEVPTVHQRAKVVPPGCVLRAAHGYCHRCYRRLRRGLPLGARQDRSKVTGGVRPCPSCGTPTIARTRADRQGARVREGRGDVCSICRGDQQRRALRRRVPAGPPLTAGTVTAVTAVLDLAVDQALLVAALGLAEAPPTVSLDTELAHYARAARGDLLLRRFS